MNHYYARRTCWAVVFFSAIVWGNAPLSAEDGMWKPATSAWTLGSPIVTYCGGPTLNDATAKQLVEGGWNLACVGSEAELDVAQRFGLRAEFNAGETISQCSLDDPERRKRLDALVDRVRNHPALYSYAVRDEPSAADFPALAKVVAYLRHRDPKHLAYINLFPCNASNEQLGADGDMTAAYRKYVRGYIDTVHPSLLSYDYYQFSILGDLNQYYLNLGLIREAALQAEIPFLNIVQACVCLPVMRIPDGDEMRCLVYTTLAYGGQGISYYVYHRPWLKGGMALADGTPTPLYHVLKTVNREFTAIAAELQPLRSLAVYHAGMTPPGTRPLPADSPFRFDPPVAPIWQWPMERVRGWLLGFFGPASKGEPTHVVAVNLDCKARGATTLIGPGNLEVFNAADSSWSAVKNNRAVLNLPPGGGKLLRLPVSLEKQGASRE